MTTVLKTVIIMSYPFHVSTHVGQFQIGCLSNWENKKQQNKKEDQRKQVMPLIEPHI